MRPVSARVAELEKRVATLGDLIVALNHKMPSSNNKDELDNIVSQLDSISDRITKTRVELARKADSCVANKAVFCAHAAFCVSLLAIIIEVIQLIGVK